MFKRFYPCAYTRSVFSIDYDKLRAKGFNAVIFDLDNTLVHHGDNSTPEVDELFRTIHRAGLKTILLTNNDEERVLRFIKNIDTLYICDADKPAFKIVLIYIFIQTGNGFPVLCFHRLVEQGKRTKSENFDGGI